MYWYLKVLKQYADFNGRARRQEYWMFVLVNIIFSIVATVLDSIFGTWGAIAGLYGLAILIPGLAVSARRLHDIGKSGWMLFVVLIPVIGAIWLIILFATEGTPESNEYGTNPKTKPLCTEST
nr:DUF805 domain-containing protein [uncultured Draconibacterium sp.]